MGCYENLTKYQKEVFRADIARLYEAAKMTFQATKDIRDKYVLSRLAWDLGVMDELCKLL